MSAEVCPSHFGLTQRRRTTLLTQEFQHAGFALAEITREQCAADPTLRQRYAMTDSDGIGVYLLFSERELAEAFAAVEAFAGNVVAIASEPELIAWLQNARRSFNG